jgi:hypothetical protein
MMVAILNYYRSCYIVKDENSPSQHIRFGRISNSVCIHRNIVECYILAEAVNVMAYFKAPSPNFYESESPIFRYISKDRYLERSVPVWTSFINS